MAKRSKKRQGNTDWQPKADDAINLATIRWFALMIEAKSIELYGTNPSVMNDIEAALKTGLSAVVAIKPKKPFGDDRDCPPGWVPCGDDCAPTCMSTPPEMD